MGTATCLSVAATAMAAVAVRKTATLSALVLTVELLRACVSYSVPMPTDAMITVLEMVMVSLDGRPNLQQSWFIRNDSDENMMVYGGEGRGDE